MEEHLQELNWQKGRNNDEQHAVTPSLTFRYPGAPTFCAFHPDIPGTIRQIPPSWDDHVDDKLKLHLLLSAAPADIISTMTPPTFVVNRAFLASLTDHDQGTNGRKEGQWFLKHRLDAKRPRVHPYATSAKLHERLQQMKEASWKYFIAQKEIHPPMLLRSRKFVLRAHVLASTSGDNFDTLRLYLHSNPLVSEHEPSALVLQSGSRSAAYLLSNALTPDLRASILDQMSTITAAVFRELQNQHPLVATLSSDETAVLYQLYGLDFMLDCTGRAFLLEVNRSPRIATGPMGGVHGCYTEFLIDAMQILGVTPTCKEPRGKFGVWRDIYRG